MSSTLSSTTPPSTPRPTPARIVLGVTGGVAAYKSVLLLRQLMDDGYFVSPVLTADALHFVGTTTFSALASEPARTSLYGDPTTPSPHTHLGQHADVIVVAPATAHVIARLAAGLANDLLTATVLASRAPVLLCPAMHTEMWEQPSVQENLATLRRRGVLVLEPAVGHLAGGDEGVGRLPEPEVIAATIRSLVDGWRGPLSGRRVLISAGGTSEAIDPVRVLTNRSSGRQGYALAEVAARMGAAVTLVSASARDLALDVRRSIEVVPVTSAAQMAEAMVSRAPNADVVIMAAAVSDFTVAAAPQKLKKADGVPTVHLVPTQDILSSLLQVKPSGQIVVGFAAETDDVMAHADAKMSTKPVDLLVVNDVSRSDAGFGSTMNEVTILSLDAEPEVVTLTSKEAVSERILARVSAMFARGAQ